jgi:hypothetical protein
MALIFQILLATISTAPFVRLEKVPRDEWDPVYSELPEGGSNIQKDQNEKDTHQLSNI